MQRPLFVIFLLRLVLISSLTLLGCEGDTTGTDGGEGTGDLSSLDKGTGEKKDTGELSDGPQVDSEAQDPCTKLAQDYLSTLALAKACNPMINTPQCLDLIDDQLGCPCETHVNQLNTIEIQELESLKQQWTSLECSVGIACTGVECPGPGQGVCKENGATNRCEDEAF